MNNWQTGFLSMLPTIRTHARISFRHLNPEARSEHIQAALCSAWNMYHRLAELDKLDLAYPTVLARFAVSQVKDHRKVGGKLNIQDVMSRYCQHKKHVSVERLDRFDRTTDEWLEIVVEDRRAGPAEVACVRLDFMAWLKSLPTRLRRIAKLLANGETTTAVARKFKLSAGRISQLRRKFYFSWLKFISGA